MCHVSRPYSSTYMRKQWTRRYFWCDYPPFLYRFLKVFIFFYIFPNFEHKLTQKRVRFSLMDLQELSIQIPTRMERMLQKLCVKKCLKAVVGQYDIVDLDLWSSSISFDSVCVRGRFISRSLTVFHIESFVIFSHWRSVSSIQIVSKFFCPLIHMNLHLEEASLASSPWINRQHPWWVQWATVWVSVRPSHVCWI